MVYTIYRPDGRSVVGINPQDPRWPAGAMPVAVAESVSFGADSNPSFLAAVPRPSGGAAPTTQTQPQAAQLLPAPQQTIGFFQNANGRWTHLFDLNGELPQQQDILMVVNAGRLYVLHAANQTSGELVVREADEWIKLPPLPQGRNLAMLSVQNQPVIVQQTTQDGQAALVLVIVSPTGGDYSIVPVRLPQEIASLPAVEPRAIAAANDRISLAWTSADKLMLASMDLAGKLSEPQQIDVLDKPVLVGHGEEILSMFVILVFTASLMITFGLRSRVEARGPFSLPANHIPAPLLRRAVATAIDLLPIVFISSFVFVTGVFGEIPLMTLEEIQQVSQQGNLPNVMAWFIVFVLSIYAAYCFVMEAKYGATIGKMAMKIRITTDGGKKPLAAQVLLRNLVKIVELSWPPVGLPFLLLLPLLNRNRQRLGDMFARTTVVNTATLPVEPPPADSQNIDENQDTTVQ